MYQLIMISTDICIAFGKGSRLGAEFASVASEYARNRSGGDTFTIFYLYDMLVTIHIY
jgi:hypothetical protein